MGRGFGAPNAENLARYVADYIESLKVGGSNAHLARDYGFIPVPNYARIVRNGSREIVAEWAAPMFMAI